MKTDNQIHELPKCANKNCGKTAYIMMSGKFLCGDCIMKFEKRKQDMMMKMVEG